VSSTEIAAFDDKLWVLEGATPNSWEVGLSGPFISHTSGQNGVKGHAQPPTETPTQWGAKGLGANRNDVWWSADGKEWHEVLDTPWAPRHAASVFVHDDALWMVAGNNMASDVWLLTRKRGQMARL
jgi:hypothetical protein